LQAPAVLSSRPSTSVPAILPHIHQITKRESNSRFIVDTRMDQKKRDKRSWGEGGSTSIVRHEPIGPIEATRTGNFWDCGGLTRSTRQLNWLTKRRRSARPIAQESLNANGSKRLVLPTPAPRHATPSDWTRPVVLSFARLSECFIHSYEFISSATLATSRISRADSTICVTRVCSPFPVQ
jgi:hypothetical protein